MHTAALTDILGSFVHGFSLRFSSIYAYANSLLRLFILIELILFGIYLALEGGEVIQSLFKKVLVLGSFQLLVANYAALIDVLRDSFVGIGLAGQMGPSLSLTQFLDPSSLISHGFTVMYPIWEHYNLLSILGSGFITVLNLFASGLIFVAFIWMAMQIFLISVEFYIVTTLAVIMIPFGLFKPTAFLADRAFGSIFAVCIKLMVLAFVASVSLPVVQGVSFTSVDPTLHETLTMLIGIGAVALVMARAPLIATGMISGSAGFEIGNGMVRSLMLALSGGMNRLGLSAGFVGMGFSGSNSSSAAGKAASIPSDVPKIGNE